MKLLEWLIIMFLIFVFIMVMLWLYTDDGVVGSALILVYTNGTTLEVDPSVIYNPFPEPTEDEEKDEDDENV